MVLLCILKIIGEVQDLTTALLPDLKKCGMDTVIVGSAITKASNIREAAKVFFEACRQ